MRALWESLESELQPANHTAASVASTTSTTPSCPVCSNFIAIEVKDLMCKSCGQKFYETCESWIEKVTEYRERKLRCRFPLCSNCYHSAFDSAKEQIDHEIDNELEHEAEIGRKRAHALKRKRRDAEQKRKETERNLAREGKRKTVEASAVGTWPCENCGTSTYLRSRTFPQSVACFECEKRWPLKNDCSDIKWLEREIVENSLGMQFELMPAGLFMTGSRKWSGSRPVHAVTIAEPFYMGIYTVTQEEWEAVMGTRPGEGTVSAKSGSR